jgi:hypothetical protein
MSGMIMMVDFEKAFDTVYWDFIQKVLDIFSFGTSIQKWVKFFQHNSESSLISNGHVSTTFQQKKEAVDKAVRFLCIYLFYV